MRISFAILSGILLHSTISFSQDRGWLWTKQFGQSAAYEQSNAIAADKNGNVYITGVAVGHLDLFISKYDSIGNLLWTKWPGRGTGYGVATDADNNIYVTGYFADSLVFGANKIYKPIGAASGNFFVVKCDSQGNLIWGNAAGEDYHESGNAICIDALGNVAVAGEFQSATFTLGNTTLINWGQSGTSDSFVVKLDSSGNILWARSAGGHSEDQAKGVTTDVLGNVIVTGLFQSSELNFDGTKLINSNITEAWNAYDIFVCKYDPTGNLIWAKREGGETWDAASDVTNDSQGNIYISGGFTGPSITIGNTTLINANTTSPYTEVSEELLVAKYDPSGNPLWAKSGTGSNRGDEGSSIDIDSDGHIYVTGFFQGDQISFDDITLVNEYTGWGETRTFIAEFNTEGNAVWATDTWGAASGEYEQALGLALDKFNNIFITGIFEGLRCKFGSTILSSPQDFDSFVAKLAGCKHFPPPTITADGLLTICKGDSVTLSSSFAPSYFWDTGESSQSIQVSQSGDYTVRTIDLNGCLLASDSIKVNVDQPQALITSSSELICPGGSATLESNSSEHYLWSTGEVTQSITISQPGNYYVKVTDVNGCSNASEAIQILEVPPLADIQLQSDCNFIFSKSDYTLTWYKDNEIFNSSLKQIQPIDSGYYYAETTNECETKQSNTVHVVPFDLNHIFIPNIITPNGDDCNEFFVVDKKLAGSVLTVVNRWGSEVYHSTDYRNNWNGGNLSEGVYFYVIQNRCFKNELTGILTLER